MRGVIIRAKSSGATASDDGGCTVWAVRETLSFRVPEALPPGFRVSGQARLRTPGGRGPSAAEVSEMIALKHLVLGAGAIRTRPGPYLESWPKIVLFVVVVAVLGGFVAIWNRSHYHP